MVELAIFVIGLVMTPISYILNGWVLGILWGWFIVPLGVDAITTYQAIGLSIVIGFVTTKLIPSHCRDNRSREEKQADTLALFFAGILSPLLTLLVGWIAHLFGG